MRNVTFVFILVLLNFKNTMAQDSYSESRSYKLLYAVDNNDEKKVMKLLRPAFMHRAANPNFLAASNSTQFEPFVNVTPLILAYRNGNLRIVQLLLDAGATLQNEALDVFSHPLFALIQNPRNDETTVINLLKFGLEQLKNKPKDKVLGVQGVLGGHLIDDAIHLKRWKVVELILGYDRSFQLSDKNIGSLVRNRAPLQIIEDVLNDRSQNLISKEDIIKWAFMDRNLSRSQNSDQYQRKLLEIMKSNFDIPFYIDGTWVVLFAIVNSSELTLDFIVQNVQVSCPLNKDELIHCLKNQGRGHLLKKLSSTYFVG